MGEETEKGGDSGETQADDVQDEDVGDPFDYDGGNLNV